MLPQDLYRWYHTLNWMLRRVWLSFAYCEAKALADQLAKKATFFCCNLVTKAGPEFCYW